MNLGVPLLVSWSAGGFLSCQEPSPVAQGSREHAETASSSEVEQRLEAAPQGSAECGPHGNLLGHSTLMVRVVDATTKRPLCGARVTAVDEAGSPFPLQPGDRSTCSVIGTEGRSGPITVRVEKGGYEPALQQAELRFDGCRWRSEPVVFELTRHGT